MKSPSAPDPAGWSTGSSYSWLIYAGLAITVVATVIVFLTFGNSLVERIAQVLNGAAPTTEQVEHVGTGTAHGPADKTSLPPHVAGRGQDLTLSDLGLLKPEPGTAEEPSQASADKHRASNQPRTHSDATPEATAPIKGRDTLKASPAPGPRVPQSTVSQQQPAETTGSEHEKANRSEPTAAPTIERPPDGLAANQSSEPLVSDMEEDTEESLEPTAKPPSGQSPAEPSPASPAENVRQPESVSPFEAPGSTQISRLEPSITRRAAPSIPHPSHESTEQPRPSSSQPITNDRREITILLAEGDSSYVIGELELARIAYSRAFEKGNAEAARRLGETFDPVQLKRDGWSQNYASPSEAILWYEDAARLGDATAAERLNDLLLWLSRSAASGSVEAQRVLDIWRDRQG